MSGSHSTRTRMKAFFLEAEVPLTKSFEIDSTGELKKTCHPRIVDYKSHEEQYKNIEELHKHLIAHAKLNHCFLKGELSRQLMHESRAGTTDSNAPTSLLLGDLDGVKGISDVDQFLAHVNLSGIDYIVQYSASMGVIPDRGMSAHIFMLLDKPTSPALLKQWLMQINLNTPLLKNNLRLARTNNSLVWPLDVTTCQNDKLIYIAPPLCGPGVIDEFKGERIQLVKGKKRHATLPAAIPSAEANKLAMEDALNTLRQASGLPKRPKITYKMQGSIEYMAKPDSAIVTEIKRERGYVYLNINGGDSWGYYHRENHPEFVHNFKSEPVYKTSELLPEYWADLQKARKEAGSDPNGNIYLAFRDFKTAAYWNGVYNAATRDLNIAQAKSESQLKHFMKQHGQELGDFIPDWNVVFNPGSDLIVDADHRIMNLYQPSLYMRMTPRQQSKVPKTIKLVIDHALGNDAEVFEHFMNWLACIVQYKSRTMTAWVLHGVPGTGKGVMLNKVLAPLLGHKYVVTKRMEELESQFNGYMEQAFILFIDEAQLSEYKRGGVMNASLKNYIVEPQISIRRMYSSPYMADNFMNIIFASNMPDPVMIDPEDRRFNVGVFQDKRLLLTDREFEEIEVELVQFYHYLATREANKEEARMPLNNTAKAKMIHISRNAIDIAADAVLQGDLEFFWDQQPSTDTTLLPAFEAQRADAYIALIKYIVLNEPKAVSREELFTLLDYTIGGMPKSPYKFSSLLKHHKLHVAPVHRDGRSIRGLPTSWVIQPEWRAVYGKT